MFTIEEACNVLHVDQGNNDELITALVEAIPDYLEVTTGVPYCNLASEPMAKTVGGLLLTQWYYADHADDQSLTRTINSLLKALALKARDYE